MSKTLIDINKIYCTKLEKYIKKYKKSLKLVKKYVKFILTKNYVNFLFLIWKKYLQDFVSQLWKLNLLKEEKMGSHVYNKVSEDLVEKFKKIVPGKVYTKDEINKDFFHIKNKKFT